MFLVITYCFNLLLGLVTFVTAIYGFKKMESKFHVLPKSLKLYMQICSLPYIIIVNFASIYCGVIFLIFKQEQLIGIEIARSIVAFAASEIRNSLFMVVVERIFATIYFEKYASSTKLAILWWLAIPSYIVSVVYISFYLYANYYSPLESFKFASLWFLFATHFATLIICAALHYLNQRMYKTFAYQINLQQRYQIFENIKVLSFIFVPIIIYTLIAPLGSVTTLIYGNIFHASLPYCTFQIFCNLSFLTIIIRQIFTNNLSAVTPLNDHTVVNPFGKQLPANIENDKYFHELKQLWN